MTRNWAGKAPPFAVKIALLHHVASISARMHNMGICHRDFYLCHFLVQGQGENPLTLIDLHRALVKNRLGQRWIIKDIAGLYFSAMDIGLSKKDLLRFIGMYSGKPLRVALKEDAAIWRQVEQRALKMKKKHG